MSTDADDPKWAKNTKLDEDAATYRGMTESEWSHRAEGQKQHLKELERKQKDLHSAKSEVESALKKLTNEKEKIDNEIKKKTKETDKLRDEFRKNAKKRQEEERKARIEREKNEMLARQEEKERKLKQIRETEKIEKKALSLHGKEKQLKQQKLVVRDAKFEVAEEIKKLRANIKYSERAIRIAQRIRTRIADRKKYW